MSGAPTVLVIMGVAGCGKTTAAIELANTMGWTYQEGDSLHPPENVEKMRGGTPLTDEDRWPWLGAIAGVIDAWLAEGTSAVLTCSALKRVYRDIIIGDRPGVRLVYIQGDRTLLQERLAGRRGHYMPPSLLDSQLATLEEPAPEENPIVVSARHAPQEIVAAILQALDQGNPPPP
ncbi:gluconokinase [Roseomonas sp. WA12]